MVLGQSPSAGVDEVIMDRLKILNVQRVLIVPGNARRCVQVLVVRSFFTFSCRQIFFVDETWVPVLVSEKKFLLGLNILACCVDVGNVIIVQRDIEFLDNVVVVETVESYIIQLLQV